ncbi:MAG: type I restriction endonuclease subunit R [Tenericutes bacterium]|nr:type I restriction endonuclease subunit R [Mycoplasmatota bacterium]
MNNKINVISDNMNSTVVCEYIPLERKDSSFQSEDQLEKELIRTLQEQAYEYINFNSEEELIQNLRNQLEKLNNIKFSQNEWNNIFNTIIANPGYGILEKTKLIQDGDTRQTITLDSGRQINIKLIDKDNIHNNSLQVINQYVNNEGNHDNRYDVTILVNGLPLIHVELKKRGVDIREAFNQIDRYQRESFWAGCGLYDFIQIFVISNGTYTKYYSNTTRELHVNSKTKKTSNTFEFTSYWADQHNNAITDLMDFARTFFAKHTILNIICRYCVFSTDNNLLVMRPYQIVATEKIINKIDIAHNYKYYGSVNAGGYIWHTTGSGKTLTSFKTAQLATELDYIDKVLFVVDRKDLDYQTMKEYDKFKEGCANSNSNTKILEEQLRDSDSRIIITTIQKLTNFIKKFPSHDAFNKQIVFIFDECHRSQFGDMHKSIISKFKKYYIFGFTGTPIFSPNATSHKGIAQTTEQVFGEKLHTYTIVNAINDKNVLPFRYEYIKTVTMKTDIRDEKVQAIDTEKALMDPLRISTVANYIFDNFARKTKNSEKYLHSSLINVKDVAKNNNASENKQKIYVNGFNSIFAVSSIEMAKMYYQAFKNIPNNNLKIALIYSYGVNEEITDYFDEENPESTENLSKSDRDFLDLAISDYNKMFGTSYDTSSEKFQNYYKDVSLRMKNREIDMLIVANMFLTGFDAKTLNTLWVDKNLKYHGLMQAFSRTNRILNSVKTFGNILCFRDLEKQLEEAIGLFGDSNASSIILLRSYKDYFEGYDDENGKHHKGYVELIQELQDKFVPGKMPIGENAQKEFVKLFGQILKARNILSSFDDFANDDMLTPRDEQDFKSTYIELYTEFRNRNKADKVDITEDLVFEMELVKQIEVNVDYILALIEKYHDSNMEDKEIYISIQKAITSSPDLRNKKDLIEQFINSLDGDSDVYKEFEEFMNKKKKEELDKIIQEENLNSEKTYNFVRRSFENGGIETTGTEIVSILPPMSRFSQNSNRSEKKNNVINKLINFFDKYFSITSYKI